MSLKNTIQYALTKVKYMFSEARIIPDSGLIIVLRGTLDFSSAADYPQNIVS